MSYQVALSVGMIMVGCCSNSITLEAMFFKDSKCGSLVTISQFIMLAVYGAFLNIEGLGFRRPKVPMYWHIFQVLLFFGSSILNNIAFKYHISMPLHSLIRSGSLAMNVIVGFVVFRYKTGWNKVFCVLIVSIGIGIATIASSNSSDKVFNLDVDYNQWLVGIGILVVALIMQALLGNAQQYGYQTWKSDANETIFYSVSVHSIHLASFEHSILCIDFWRYTSEYCKFQCIPSYSSKYTNSNIMGH